MTANTNTKCLKCKQILTFCKCDEPITDKDEYVAYLKDIADIHIHSSSMFE